MRITSKGWEITNVPGVEKIEVLPANHSGGIVDIFIYLPGIEPISYDLDGLRELIGGLEQAGRQAEFMIKHDYAGGPDE
jgi:hypothetical protein